MSSTSNPIPLPRFAEAITDLPLANLHFKAAEIRNSIAHLRSSNQELQVFADEGDQDCADAVKENGELIVQMEERVLLLRREVEMRGYQWGDDEVTEVYGIGGAEVRDVAVQDPDGAEESRGGTHPSGETIGDGELARRLREEIEENRREDGGVHL